MSKTKHEVLLENEYEFIEGYVLDYEKDSDMLSIIISRKEIEGFYNKKAENYYFKKGYDYSKDEESAWEELYDDYCNNNNLDITFEEFNKKMLEEDAVKG
jgi:hypothetical protein